MKDFISSSRVGDSRSEIIVESLAASRTGVGGHSFSCRVGRQPGSRLSPAPNGAFGGLPQQEILEHELAFPAEKRATARAACQCAATVSGPASPLTS
jgi:hypothetical protein